MNPFKKYVEENRHLFAQNNNYERDSLSEAFWELIIANGPYHYFITLTFGRHIGKQKMYQYTNFLIHIYNQKIFSRKYKERRNFIKGFAFFEKHPSKKFEEKYHIHLLLRCNENYDFNTNESIFRMAAGKVFDGKGRNVFKQECIKIKDVYSSGVVDYSMKEINRGKIFNLKTISCEGLSDSQ